jgi:hypothetical protein
MFHCHIFSHMHAPGAHSGHKMSGLVTTLDVEPNPVPAAPSLNGVPAAPGVPAGPVIPGPDNPSAGDGKDDQGGEPPPTPSPPEAPHH